MPESLPPAARLRDPAADPAAIARDAAASGDVGPLLETLRDVLAGDRLAGAIEAAAGVCREKGRPLDRLRCLRALADLSEASAADRARWGSDLAAQLEDLDRLEEASAALVRAVAASRDAADAALEGRLQNRLGTLLHTRGDLARALEAYRGSLAIKESLKDDRGTWNTLLNMAALHRELGEPAEALRTAERAANLPGQDPRRIAQAWSLAAHAALEAGQAGEAFDRARDAFRAAGDLEGEALLQIDQATIHLRRGDESAARTLMSRLPSSGIPSALQARADALRQRLEPVPGGGALLARLLEINRSLLSRQDGPALLREIVDAAVELLAAERGFCILAAGDGFEIAAARHVSRQTIDRPQFKISRTVADRVAKMGQAVRTDNATTDPAMENLRSIAELQIRSICCVPLRAEGRVLGSLYLDHRGRAGAFGPSDLGTLQALADQAAVALTQLRLREETLRQQKDLERMNAVLRSVNRGLEQRIDTQSRILDRAESARTGRDRYDQLIGASAAMQDVYKLLDRLETSQDTVLITGESGTGKELLARAVHHRSPRKAGPIVSINCGALAESLLESELFGHVKGAFTGAGADRAGVFEQADGGSLFLDEIGEMSMETQKRLLRVLQEREIRRVGDTKDRKVNVRIVAATNRDLQEAVEDKEFREDLYYRLNVIPLKLPPLRDRKEDIPLLVAHFLERIAAESGGPRPSLAGDLVGRLQARDWPGNVRELENAVRRLIALGDEALEPEREAPAPRPAAAEALRPLEEVELEHIRKVLSATGGNVTEASRILGIGSATLWRRLRKFNLKP